MPRPLFKTIEWAPAPAEFKSLIACRKEPTPLSLVLVTANWAAQIGVGSPTMNRATTRTLKIAVRLGVRTREAEARTTLVRVSAHFEANHRTLITALTFP